METNHLRTHRIKKGYSQEYVAFYLNITQKAYSKIENGHTKLTVNRLKELAIILDISKEEMLEYIK